MSIKSWWGNTSKPFRIWSIGTVLWFPFLFVYASVFEKDYLLYDIGHVPDKSLYQGCIWMLLPPLLSGVALWVYLKLTK